MVSIGDPFAVLNRFAFITYSYNVNMTLTYARSSARSLSREKTNRIIEIAIRCKRFYRSLELRLRRAHGSRIATRGDKRMDARRQENESVRKRKAQPVSGLPRVS